ncbi:MAG: hypothetical protein IID42_14270 [Planctomycetes bacterium]|nr:hypothetical protein [Planctomycetota bacterium]
MATSRRLRRRKQYRHNGNSWINHCGIALRYAHSHDRWFRFDKKKGVVYLTKLYDWYQGDFEQAADSVRDFAARYAPALKQALQRGDRLRTAWLDYDWTLNDKRNAR